MININKKCLKISLDTCKFIGSGREGKVYKTEDDYVLKVFKRKRNSLEEYKILKMVEGSRYFPKVISIKGRYLLREYVDGVALNEYIKKEGMPKELSYNLVYLFEEFKNMGFTRLDMSARHIYVGDNYKLKVIDPRKCYSKKVSFPKILLQELDEAKVLDDFIKGVIDISPELAIKWSKKISNR
ncbi:serine/threonine protein kinase [Clostridium botulinum]|uniref:serine/threonine protein kinase n=1 Tax=Clostridium botulinum TaxID=1491 RepID=UPI0004DA0BF6|nr:serine/threonine protein kinase [Clostridium botulinum]KEI01093.1 serine/threonine protein kinase [Clostridium botulinum C/D str. BKT75002]KEI13428.1 serine/threonine protein kinase [Clostridium botulinum C/D str. BKT2873]KOC50755.1 serine/threonine protein kinase [Clostridium botulinum]KOC53382.1 serine/threonine protein kinase [Clostridium botulinum]KOC57164.1 serine/threonine protein kinase [Clostridium botulinum]